jgi:hypothetical protein
MHEKSPRLVSRFFECCLFECRFLARFDERPPDFETVVPSLFAVPGDGGGGGEVREELEDPLGVAPVLELGGSTRS